MNNIKHLYIHIPFCKSICTYCNFKKIIYEEQKANQYIDKIINDIEKLNNKFVTIYIGGGTPNCLSNEQLGKLLSSLQNNINNDTEFTIELNPEFVTKDQINLLEKYHVNRLSIGIQILNNKILKIINRIHNLEQIEKAMAIIESSNINNISCDFIYNLPSMKKSDIDDIINFINKHDIKHISYYSLELKDGSIMDKLNYKIDENLEEEFMDYVHEQLKNKTKLKRYEISNWAINDKYRSKHNIAYWNIEQWYGIGWGACGYVNQQYIENIGDELNWSPEITNENKEEYYKTILMMGLRQVDGIDLSIKRNKDAFNCFKDKLDSNLYSIDNNFLKVNNIDLLHNLLYHIF